MTIKELQQRLDASPALKAAFFEDPEGVLEQSGVTLNAPGIAGQVASALRPAAAPSGSTMGDASRLAVINYMSKA